MIESISLRFGSAAGVSSLSFQPTPITIFVGPNYSGKSKLISEIYQRCVAPNSTSGEVIVNDIIFKERTEADAAKLIEMMRLPPKPGEMLLPSHMIVGRRGSRQQVDQNITMMAIKNPNNNQSKYPFGIFMGMQTLMLNGSNRISLVNDQPGGDLQAMPANTFQHLFRDDGLRARLSDLVYRALGLFLTIDPTNLGHLRMRLSRERPPSAAIERGLSAESVNFHKETTLIQNASDGAKAFVGILSEILAGDPEILFIDEPEAFLHPGLAYQLGLEISSNISNSSKQMYVSTHSPQFLMGCIQSGVPINVIRLTYKEGVATARLLPSEQIKNLMRNPLLRSTGMMSAIFYESVVVTEADPDRVFYQEINERLLRSRDPRGIENCIFLNAQNKHTIPTLLSPLRRLGIPAAAIYDIDFVKDGGGVATNFMSSAQLPPLSQKSLSQNRADILKALEATGKNFKTAGGVGILESSDQEAANNYLDQLANYGAFIVRGGELESWLQDLGVPGHGPGWLIPMFERMGEDPSDPVYVAPSDGDVWDFIGTVKRWTNDPLRKGIPT